MPAEYDTTHDPERAPRTEAQLELVTLTREAYPIDSIGFSHFPEVLEGRDRPAHATDIFLDYGPKTKEVLGDLGVSNLGDLLYLTDTQLSTLRAVHQDHIRQGLDKNMLRFENRVAVTPHGDLMAGIFGLDQGPVSIEDEPALAKAVGTVLEEVLEDDDRAFLALRFGLDTWQKVTLDEAGSVFHKTREQIRSKESKILSKLRQADELAALERFRALPLSSLGRSAGLTYLREVPELPITAGSLGLSPETLYELGVRPRGFSWDNDAEMGRFLSQPRTVPDEARQEVAAKVQKAMRTYQQHVVFGDLLPEVLVPQGATGVARNTRLSDFNLSTRARMDLHRTELHTLGALLGISRNERGKVEPISPEVAQELGDTALTLLSYLDVIAEAP